MKFIFHLLALVVLLSCGHASNESKAKKLIRDHLYKTLHDYKSYEPVEFEKIDTLYSAAIDDSLFNLYRTLADKYLDSANGLTNELKNSYLLPSSSVVLIQEKGERTMDSAQYFIKKMEEREKIFKPDFIGWKMNHSFRAKSLGGNLGIHHYRYKFDKDFKEITGEDDISGKPKP